MSRFPTGVAVVTGCHPNGDPCGLTANSLTSVSLDPLFLLVCLGKGSTSHDSVVEGGRFAVNILGAGSKELSIRFAEVAPEDRFAGVEHHPGVTGSPILNEAIAWLDCRVAQLHDAGDHTIVVGEVLACSTEGEADPLVYHGGTYRQVGDPT